LFGERPSTKKEGIKMVSGINSIMKGRRTAQELIRIRAFWTMVMLAIFTGCSNPFAPPGGGSGSNNKSLKEPTTPENVLYNLEWAMNNKDIQVYERCLDEDFWYHSPPIYPDDPESIQEWAKEDELTVMRRMFGQDPTYQGTEPFETIEFRFDYGEPEVEFAVSNPEEPMNDHPDEDWVVFSGPITIHLRYSEGHGWDVQNQLIDIKLRKRSDGTWAIIRWWDYPL